MDNEIKIIKNIMKNKNVKEYILGNLRSSLPSMGYSKKLIRGLIDSFENGGFKKFQQNYKEELSRIRIIDFFQKTAPPYFKKQVIPYIPKSKTILDLGCGTGILAHLLERSGKFKKIIGIDINKYSEWDKFRSEKVKLSVVLENEFNDFLRKVQPETIVLTWVLHHMTFEEQERYLKNIYSLLDEVTLVALEDSFSVNLPPEEDIGVHNSFNIFSLKEKKYIISVLDWIANRILGMKDDMPIPFAYRTLEDWQKFFEKIGFEVIKKRYIGFPRNRDVNTPQSLIVVRKVKSPTK